MRKMIIKIIVVRYIWLALATFLIFATGNSFSQVTRLKYIGVESGMTFIESEMTDMDLIRADIPNYSSDFPTSSLTNLSHAWYAGVKAEIFSLNDRFGLQGGIRFSQVSNSIGKDEYWGSSTNYFYWLYRQEGTETEFLKIKDINQKTNYLGMPVEIRYFISRRPHIFQLYAKIGAVLDFRVNTDTHVEFKDPTMEPYEKDISNQIKQPGPVSFAMYAGSGFKIGTDQKPSVSIEACFPYLILTPHSYGMLYPYFGGGFQITFQLPIKSK